MFSGQCAFWNANQVELDFTTSRYLYIKEIPCTLCQSEPSLYYIDALFLMLIPAKNLLFYVINLLIIFSLVLVSRYQAQHCTGKWVLFIPMVHYPSIFPCRHHKARVRNKSGDIERSNAVQSWDFPPQTSCGGCAEALRSPWRDFYVPPHLFPAQVARSRMQKLSRGWAGTAEQLVGSTTALGPRHLSDRGENELAFLPALVLPC